MITSTNTNIDYDNGPLNGLKGLTSKDREAWEKSYSANLQGLTEPEKYERWVRYNFYHKFKDNPKIMRLAKSTGKNLKLLTDLYNGDYKDPNSEFNIDPNILKPRGINDIQQDRDVINTGSTSLVKDVATNNRYREVAEKIFGDFHRNPENKKVKDEIDELNRRIRVKRGAKAFIERTAIKTAINDPASISELEKRKRTLEVQYNSRLDSLGKQYNAIKYGDNYRNMPDKLSSPFIFPPEIQNDTRYQEALIRYDKDFERYYQSNRKNIDSVQKIAEQISPAYRKYQGTEKLPLSASDWEEITRQYTALYQSYGEDTANEYIQRYMQDTVASNQSVAEKWWNGLQTMGAEAAATMITLAGMSYGVQSYILGGFINKGLSFSAFIDSVIDNDITRYANKVMKYGTLIPTLQKQAEKEGFSSIPILKSYDEMTGRASFLETITSSSFLPDLFGQYGFTAGSMMVGGATSKVGQSLFNLGKGRAVSALTTGRATLTATKELLQKIQSAERTFNRIMVPGITGSVEGAVEGLNTKLEVLEAGMAELEKYDDKWVDNRVNEIASKEFNDKIEAKRKELLEQSGIREEKSVPVLDEYTEKIIKEEVFKDIYNQARQEAADLRAQAEAQIEFAASRAGYINFLINSTINGFINHTLTNTIYSPSVREQIKSSKLNKALGNMFGGKPKFTITGEGANATVTANKRGVFGTALKYLKEPAGEFTEEWTQGGSDEFSQKGAMFNITSFLENKYNGEGTALVGDTFSGEFIAAMSGALGRMFSKEGAMEGFYGAASSIFGGIYMPRRTRKLDANGKPTGETVLFGRGANAAGEKENIFEMFTRIMPWRSSIGTVHNDLLAERKRNEEEAKALTDWVRDPRNRDKFMSVNGVVNWAKAMQDALDRGDEFGYRTSTRGKAVNDALMLSKLKGTAYYDEVMKSINHILGAKVDSEEGQDIISTLKGNVKTKDSFSNMSDEETLNQAKKNAQELLDNQKRVEEIGDKIDSLFGELDEDTKVSLIYGEMQIEDFKDRLPKVEEEIIEVYKKAYGVESSPVSSNKDFAIIARNGSVSNLRKQKAKLEDQVDNLKKEIKEGNEALNRTYKTKKEKAKAKEEIKNKKYQLEQTEKSLKKIEENLEKLDALYGKTDNEGNRVIEDNDATLSEDEIMGLSAKDRAYMLNKNNRSNYNRKQQQIIEDLEKKLIASDAGVMNKIQDAGKIESYLENFIKEYAAVASSPEAFNYYALNAKHKAALAIYRRKYDSINDIEDYNEFAFKMDNLISNSSNAECKAVLDKFEKEEAENKKNGIRTNYSKYKEDRELAIGVLNTALTSNLFSNLNSNQIGLITRAVGYLTELGIDLNDGNTITAALMETDEQGNGKFESYIRALNEEAADYEKLEYDNPGIIIQTIKDAVKRYYETKREDEVLNAPIQEGPSTIEEGTTPAVTPTPTDQRPGVFATAATTQEEADASLAAEKAETPQPVSTGNPVLDKFLKNSSKSVGDLVTKLFNHIGNIEDASTRSAVTDVFDTIAGNSFTDPKSLISAIQDEIDNLREGDNSSDKVISSLQDLKYRTQIIIKAEENREKKEKEKKMEEQAAARSRSSILSKVLGRGIAPQALSTNSSEMHTIDLENLFKEWSIDPNEPNYHPLARYADKHGITQFLQKENIRDSEIFFISDPVLAKEIAEWNFKADESNRQKEDAIIPIIAVVKSNDGDITIDGESEKYQAIGIMPETGNKNYAGSDRLNFIRNRVNRQEDKPTLLTDKGGKVLRTRGIVRGHNENRERTSAEQAMMSTLTEEEKSSMRNMTPQEKRKSLLWKKIRKAFIDKLIYEKRPVIDSSTGEQKKDGRGNPEWYYGLFYSTDNKKDNKDRGTMVLTVPISESEHRDTGDNILSLLIEGNPRVLNANSRIEGALKELVKALEDTSFSSLGSYVEGTDNLNDRGKKELYDLARRLESRIAKYIYVPWGDGKDIELRVTHNKETNLFSVDLVLSPSKIVDNKRIQEDEQIINLGVFNKNNISPSQKVHFLKQLLVDEKGEERKNPVASLKGERTLAKWQVKRAEVDIRKEEHTPEGKRAMADKHLTDLFDDGVLMIQRESAEYTMTTVTLQSPFTESGATSPIVDVVANGDNATRATGHDNDIKDKNGKNPINPYTGRPKGEDNQEKIITEEVLNALHKIVERVTSDAENFDITEDEKNYIHRVTKKLFARVTALRNADKRTKEYAKREEDDSNLTPGYISANIGTGFDEFVRDIIGGKVKKVNGVYTVDGVRLSDIYPNASEQTLQAFAQEVVSFKAKLEKDKNITFVSRDVVAVGTVEVLDDQGQVHTIDTAGTVDLLGYDAEGNWYLYDMKTRYQGKYDDEDKLEYALQLSLYKKFLEQTYGIRIKEIGVVPIQVDWEYKKNKVYRRSTAPTHNKYMGKKNNQVLEGNKKLEVGVKLCKNLRLKRQSGFDMNHNIWKLEETGLDIDYSRLSDAEKKAMDNILGEVTERLQNGGAEVDAGKDNVDITAETKAVKVVSGDEDASKKKSLYKGRIIKGKNKTSEPLTPEQQAILEDKREAAKLGVSIPYMWSNLSEEDKEKILNNKLYEVKSKDDWYALSDFQRARVLECG